MRSAEISTDWNVINILGCAHLCYWFVIYDVCRPRISSQNNNWQIIPAINFLFYAWKHMPGFILTLTHNHLFIQRVMFILGGEAGCFIPQCNSLSGPKFVTAWPHYRKNSMGKFNIKLELYYETLLSYILTNHYRLTLLIAFPSVLLDLPVIKTYVRVLSIYRISVRAEIYIYSWKSEHFGNAIFIFTFQYWSGLYKHVLQATLQCTSL